MLKCSSNLRYCRTRNLYIDFRRFKETSQSEGRYKRCCWQYIVFVFTKKCVYLLTDKITNRRSSCGCLFSVALCLHTINFTHISISSQFVKSMFFSVFACVVSWRTSLKKERSEVIVSLTRHCTVSRESTSHHYRVGLPSWNSTHSWTSDQPTRRTVMRRSQSQLFLSNWMQVCGIVMTVCVCVCVECILRWIETST